MKPVCLLHTGLRKIKTMNYDKLAQSQNAIELKCVSLLDDMHHQVRAANTLLEQTLMKTLGDCSINRVNKIKYMVKTYASHDLHLLFRVDSKIIEITQLLIQAEYAYKGTLEISGNYEMNQHLANIEKD